MSAKYVAMVNPLFWRWGSRALMIAGLAWVGYLLITTVEDPARFIPDNMTWLVAATGLVALSMAANIWLFTLFLHTEPKRCYHFLLVVKLSVVGQLLRYLPGRFWGIAYQISAAREYIPAMHLARANIDLMVFSLFGSVIVALVLLGRQWGWPWGVLVALSTLGIVLLSGLFLGGANWLLRVFACYLPNKARRILDELAIGQPTVSRLVLIITIFIGGWILYLAAWNLLGLVFYNFSNVNFTILCALYTLASIIGIVSALTPAGLGVREAAFIVLATGSTTQEAAAFFAVFGRIWLMLIEVIILIIVVSFLSITKKANE